MQTKLISLLTLSVLVATPALADKPNPYAQADASWISISGTAVNPTASTFTLDYGDGTILVEMDDWDALGDAHGLLDGDKVTVNGRIDDDLYERHKIEAGSVYVESLGTYFYASAADEEGAPYWSVTTPIVVSSSTLTGTVDGVQLAEREFTVDTGQQRVTVEIEDMPYNPLDQQGFQKIARGDVVRVTGHADRDFLEGRVFDADAVVTLWDESANDSTAMAN